MKPSVDVKIIPAKEEDFLRIGKFMQKYFFPDEPLNAALNRCPPIEELFVKDLLQENMSFLAINTLADEENQLLGVVINKEATCTRKDTSLASSPEQKKIYEILNKLNEISNTWEVVNRENHFNIISVSVKDTCRGLKIGQKLVEESLKLAKSLGYKFATIECSSFYSARFVTSMDFELIGKIIYSEYLDENNKQVFKVKKPHTSVQKFILRL